MSQLIFDFTASEDRSARSYLPLTSHLKALQALKFLEEGQGFKGLRLVGQAGTGKTHLLQAWCALTGTNYGMSDHAPAVAVDDVEESPAEEVFHLYNRLYKQEGTLVVATTEPLTPNTKLLPDLRSRLLTLPEVVLAQPTDEDLTKLLVKWAGDRQLALKPDVVKYLLARAARNPAQLREMVGALDVLSLAEKRAVTVPLARQVLQENL
jgi:chromosomal replication initiation ATPase DnaA